MHTPIRRHRHVTIIACVVRATSKPYPIHIQFIITSIVLSRFVMVFVIVLWVQMKMWISAQRMCARDVLVCCTVKKMIFAFIVINIAMELSNVNNLKTMKVYVILSHVQRHAIASERQ